MVLEDENGLEYDAIYIGNRTGLSGGWRAFAMDHKLEDGDALVFELVKPDRFKVIFFCILYVNMLYNHCYFVLHGYLHVTIDLNL